jgi:MFS superfamily sulfate permease-like transporter
MIAALEAVGVILAMLLFLRRMATSVEVLPVAASDLQVPPPADVMIYSIEGPFFFGAVESWELVGEQAGKQRYFQELRDALRACSVDKQ